MASALDDLYKTKLQLIAVVTVVAGIALQVLGKFLRTVEAPSWVSGLLPISEIGSTLFTTGLLAIFFEYIDRKHGETRTDQRIREAVRAEAPAIRDAVLDNFAFDPSALKNIAAPETLDRIAANALGLRLNEPTLAAEVYRDVRNQVIQAPERWHHARTTVELTPWSGGPATGRDSMFVATVRREYRCVPANSTLRFACVSDPDEYRELLRDQTVAAVWHYDRSAAVDATSPEAFELVQASVDGRARPVRRSQRSGGQTYSVSLGRDLGDGEAVTIAYTYRVLVHRHGHVFYLDIPRPTKGLKVQFVYTDAGIRRVTALDFIASSEQAQVEYSPESVPVRSVDVSFDGWAFPRSGVAFVWVLADEIKA